MFYDDLTVTKNGDGADELAFRTPALAEDFAFAALACSHIYVSDEDRYAMQLLSELLRTALLHGVLTEADLHTTEPQVIAKLLADPETAALWLRYRSLHAMRTDAPNSGGPWRVVPAKKRYIDPLIEGRGRVSAYDPALKAAIDAFLTMPQNIPIAAE